MNTLSEKTLVPLSIAILGIGGGSYWLSTIYQQGQFNALMLSKMESKMEVLADMRTDIEKIKLKVEQLERPVTRTSAQVDVINRKIQSVPKPASLYACPSYNQNLFSKTKFPL